MKPNIVVVGSSNTDMIVKLPRLPRTGETILGGAFAMAAGGKGANQAVAAARAGGSVSFITRVGDDLFGKQALDGYAKEGMDISLSTIDSFEATGVAFILIGSQGENTIAVASGANLALTELDVRKAEAVLRSASILLVQFEVPMPAVKAAVEIAAAAGVAVIMNPAPAQPVDDDLLQLVSVITPNETETELLTGIPVTSDENIAKAAAQLRTRGVGMAVITLGARGCYVDSNAFTGFINSFTVHAVDTTAAGDVFNGALAVALMEKQDSREAFRFANAAAALSVTKLGAQPSAPARPEINAFLQQHPAGR